MKTHIYNWWGDVNPDYSRTKDEKIASTECVPVPILTFDHVREIVCDELASRPRDDIDTRQKTLTPYGYFKFDIAWGTTEKVLDKYCGTEGVFPLYDSGAVNLLIDQRDELLLRLEACVDCLGRIRNDHSIKTSAEVAAIETILRMKGGV